MLLFCPKGEIQIVSKIGILIDQILAILLLRRDSAMRLTLRTKSMIIVLGLFASSVSFAAGNVEQGKIKSETCLGCHGVPSYTNVYPTYHVPLLGGQHADYIVAALKGYKSGERNHGTMQAQAAGMSEEDMADIGAYFQSLK
jgi:cytochrome c553